MEFSGAVAGDGEVQQSLNKYVLVVAAVIRLVLVRNTFLPR